MENGKGDVYLLCPDCNGLTYGTGIRGKFTDSVLCHKCNNEIHVRRVGNYSSVTSPQKPLYVRYDVGVYIEGEECPVEAEG